MTEIEHMTARVQHVGAPEQLQLVLLWRGWQFSGHPGKVWMHYKTSRNSRETSRLHFKDFTNEREFAVACMECLEVAPALNWYPIEGPEELHKISNPDAYVAAYDAWKAAQCL